MFYHLFFAFHDFAFEIVLSLDSLLRGNDGVVAKITKLAVVRIMNWQQLMKRRGRVFVSASM
jgi:hypothetical protein